MKRLLPTLALLTALLCATAQAQVNSDQALNYQINATHTGSVNPPGLTPPFRQKWSVNFGQNISYPIIAGGKVFVTVRNASTYGTVLYALDGATGATLWSYALGGAYYWSALCYENGRVFALNYNGLLRAFDAAGGGLVWSRQLPGQYAFSSAPTAFQGVVYAGGAGSGGTVYAVSEATGAVLWTAPVANGDDSSPAVTADGLYVSYACANVYKLNPASGALMWRFQTGCSGGGGKTPVLYNGRLYARDFSNYIFDSQTGTQVGSFVAKNAPAFSGDMGFFLNGPTYYGSYGTLEGRNLTTNAVVWSFAGDGYLQSAPLVVNGYVLIGSNTGKLYALDSATGRQVWSANAGVGIPYVDEQNVSQPLTGMAAGEGLLVVPTNTTLVAYESDHVAPTVAWGDKTPSADAAGWNNTPVDLPFTASDDLSGVASFTPDNPLHFYNEGANQTQQVTVTDKAGNTANVTSPAVNIDLSAPSTSASLSGQNGNGEWYAGAAQLTLAAADSLSGVATTFYTVDGGAAQTYASPFDITADGSHTVNYWSTDVAGNVEAQQSTSVKIDVSAPTTQASVASLSSSNGWYQNPAQVSLNASDGGSGVANTFYAVDGGGAQTYSAPVIVTGDGSHTVNYWSVDAVGNVESQQTLTVNVDASAPSTQLSATGAAGSNGWYRSSVQISLTSSDNHAGVGNTFFSIDGGAALNYAGPFTVSGNGRHSVNFWSVDRVGNTEGAQSASINIDTDAPRGSALVFGPSGGGGYFNGPAQMSVSATDDLSGAASIYYRLDGGPTQTYASPINISGDGAHSVELWFVDLAGNSTTPATSTVRIDTTAPVTQGAVSGGGSNGWYRTAAQVSFTSSDNLSGVAATLYKIDGGAVQTYAGPFAVSSAGTHVVFFWSRDVANNTEQQRSVSFGVDSTAPVVTASASPSTASKSNRALTVTVSGRVTDALSGVKSGGATYSVVDEYGVTQPSGAAVLQADGSYSLNLSLPATRNNKDSAHVYTITVRASDQAGNTGAASTTVTIF
jgi:outer membrane protein assembly factor BamB